MFQQLPSKFNILKSSFLITMLFFAATIQLGADTVAAEVQSNIPSAAENLSFFVENQGQFDPTVRFQGPTTQSPLWLTQDSIWVSALEQSGGNVNQLLNSTEHNKVSGVHFQLSFLNGNPDVIIEPFAPLATRLNYFMGQTADNWQTDLVAWQGVRYKNLYDGFDLEMLTVGGQLQMQLVANDRMTTDHKIDDAVQAARHRSLSAVGFQIDGAELISTVGDQLVLEAADLQISLPLIQIVDQAGVFAKVSAASRPQIQGNKIQRPFAPAALSSPVSNNANQSMPQGIDDAQVDPAYSLYLGGGNLDQVYGIDVGPDERIVVAGHTASLTFPTNSGSFDTVYSGTQDAFVLKLGVNGNTLIYGTFLGGSGNDTARSVQVDDGGSAYVTGLTQSTDFPTRANGYSTEHQGADDIFLLKLTNGGDQLFYSTLFGGSGIDFAYDLAVGSNRDVYITGYTESENFPLTGNAHDTIYSGGQDAFVARFRQASGIQLNYSTFIGGFAQDKAYAIAVDGEGYAYITGHTNSKFYDSTSDTFDESYNGGVDNFGDAFITKVDLDGSNLVYSTFLGGSGAEGQFGDIVVTEDGEAIVTGRTNSSNFPTTAEAYDTTYNGGGDIYITRLNGAGDALVYSTFVGGSNTEQGNAIHIDNLGIVTIAGPTLSDDFPIFKPDTFEGSNSGGVDGYVFKLGPNGQNPMDSDYYGGSDLDIISTMTADNDGNVYIGGWTQSGNFPALGGTSEFNNSYAGGTDGFAAKLRLSDNAATGIFPLSGHVVDHNNNPLPAVRVTVGSVTKITDNNGSYLFENVPLGIYKVMPERDGYGFSPEYSVIELYTDQINQPLNFIAQPTDSDIESFLELPIQSDQRNILNSATLNALRDVTEGGRILAWFDHDGPTTRSNGQLQLWDGILHHTNPVYQNGTCYGGRCYDGMNGIGFTPSVAGNRTVVAAADGTVVEIENECDNSQRNCSNGYGNFVVIQHDNGYYTRYARLQELDTQTDETVASDDVIGTMGDVGIGSGTYLHFTVHKDDGDGRWEGDSQDKVVDPFGWRGNQTDPWVVEHQGPISAWLWNQSPNNTVIIEGDGPVGLSNVLGTLTVDIPNETFSGKVELLLSSGGSSLVQPQDNHIQLGATFRIQPEEWLSGSTVDGILQLTQPMEINIDLLGFVNSDLENTGTHIEETLEQVTLYYWDEMNARWEAQETTINDAGTLLTATTKRLGRFSIQAPLRCTTDNMEPDDFFYSGRATAAAIPGRDAQITRVFDSAKDVDWFRISAQSERLHDIYTRNLTDGVGTVIELYDRDGLTLLLSSTSSEAGSGAKIEDWEAPHTGYYFVRVAPTEDSMVGCQAAYDLTVAHPGFNIYLPQIVH